MTLHTLSGSREARVDACLRSECADGGRLDSAIRSGVPIELVDHVAAFLIMAALGPTVDSDQPSGNAEVCNRDRVTVVLRYLRQRGVAWESDGVADAVVAALSDPA